MERTLVGSTLSGDCDGDVVGALALERHRLTASDRIPLCDDPRACEVVGGVKQMHVPALAAAQPGVTTVDLSRHGVHVHTVGQREVVRSVGSCDGVVAVQMGAHAHGCRFLTGGEVHLSGDQSGTDVPRRRLVGVVLLQDPGFVLPDPHHLSVEVEAVERVHGTLSLTGVSAR
jgi:hypothetical protein